MSSILLQCSITENPVESQEIEWIVLYLTIVFFQRTLDTPMDTIQSKWCTGIVTLWAL